MKTQTDGVDAWENGGARLTLSQLAQLAAIQGGRLIRFLVIGPDDFITAAFSPADVLSRLWRLHPVSSGSDSVVRQLKQKLGLKQSQRT